MHVGYAMSLLDARYRHDYTTPEPGMVADVATTLCHRFDLRPSEATEIALEALDATFPG